MSVKTIRVRYLQDKLAAFAIEREWSKYHSPKNLSMALIVEAAELVEHFQWLTAEESISVASSEETLADVREEMADVFLYLIRLADILNVDLEQAALDKIKINEEKYPVALSKGNATKYNKR